MIKWLEKIFDFMASIRLAVVVILSLGVLSAVGTIYESLYDRVYAQKLIYHSMAMWMVMALLAVNITAVMFDRWPWKRHHTAFVLAHIGILILLFGSVVTYVGGVDGTMIFEIGGRNRYVLLQSHDFSVYTSMDGNEYTILHQEPVDFFNRDFKKKPYKLKLAEGELEVLEYHHFALAQRDIKAGQVLPEQSIDTYTPAVQFLLEGSQANQSGWLFKERSKAFDKFEMGIATVVLANDNYQRIDGNEMVFRARGDELFYEIYRDGNEKPIVSGQWKEGEVITTGWMDFKVRVLKFFPTAELRTVYTPRESFSAAAVSSIKVRYQGEEYDIGLNAPLKVFEKDRVNVIAWGSLRHDIGFDIHLENFAVGRYQGTNKAMSYESTIRVNDEKDTHLISMNEPFKRNGLTFYQSSFQEDEMGRATHSVLSVNKDPGRALKYLGSFVIFLGTAMLFWFRNVYFNKTPQRAAAAKADGPRGQGPKGKSSSKPEQAPLK